MGQKVILRDVRLAFVSVHQRAKPIDDDDKPKFEVTALLDNTANHAAIKLLSDSIKEVAKEFFGGRIPADLKHCMRKGAEKEKDDGTYLDGFGPDMRFVRCKSDRRPKLMDADGETPLVEDDGKPYSGCYGNVILELYAQQHKKGGKRVNAALLGVQFKRDGDAFSGGEKVEDDDWDTDGDYEEEYADDDGLLD